LYRASLEFRVTDDMLIEFFEKGQEPPGGFHHRDHVRVAWWYLRQHSWLDALDRFRQALQRFAAAQGSPERYHETVTTAYVLLINERLIGNARDLTWEGFSASNPDLLSWKPSILDRYYRPETLMSDRARQTFVMPDRHLPA
jgi:hypothetical protein